jgi:hypothetical protein
MSFTYSTIKTETLAEGDRLFLGYNVGSAGVVMNVRLRYKTPGEVPTKEDTFYLPGDTVAGLVAGMAGSPFTVLKTDDLGNNVTRYMRAYQTPAGNILLHDYMVMVLTISGKTHTINTDEHFCVIEAGTLSGTSITKTARRGSVSTSGATNYGSSASWQDVFVAPAGAGLSLLVPANLNDVLEANLVFSGYNSIGAGMIVDVRILLGSTEVAWCRNEHDGSSVDRNFSIRGSIVIPSTGTHTLKVQLFVNGAEFDTFIQHYGAARGKLEYRLFYP